MGKTNWVTLILILIIFGMGAVLILREPAPILEPFDDSALREEIRLKDSAAVHWESVADIAIQAKDSLENTKSEIQYEYREVYRTLTTASNEQLDSILRANW